MRRCWRSEPAARPKFVEIGQTINDLYSAELGRLDHLLRDVSGVLRDVFQRTNTNYNYAHLSAAAEDVGRRATASRLDDEPPYQDLAAGHKTYAVAATERAGLLRFYEAAHSDAVPQLHGGDEAR